MSSGVEVLQSDFPHVFGVTPRSPCGNGEEDPVRIQSSGIKI